MKLIYLSVRHGVALTTTDTWSVYLPVRQADQLDGELF